MPKLVWNGKFEVTPKEIGVAAWLIWMAAAGWYKLEALDKTMKEHLWEAGNRAQTTIVHEARLHELEARVDDCCIGQHRRRAR